ncbi:MAG: MATE family efflux transporter [Planctomycetota bacterium]
MSALSVLVARVLAFVSVFGFNAVLARTLVPEEFGLFALLFSMATLACLVASCGLNRALVKILADQSYANDGKNLRRILNIGLLTSVIAGCLVGLMAYGIVTSFFSFQGDLGNIAFWFGSIIAIRTSHFVMAETIRGLHETNWSNLFGGPAGGPLPHMLFLGLLIYVSLYKIQLNLPTVLACYFGSFALTLLPLVFRCYSLSNSQPFEHESRESKRLTSRYILELAVPIMLTQSFGLMLTQSDVWMAGAMVLPAALAVYCSAQRMLAFLTIPLQISSTALVPLVAELVSSKRKSEFQEILGLATFVAGIPSILIAVVLLQFPELILSIAFGEFYAQAAPILQVLVVGQLVCALTGPCEMVLIMGGHQKKALVVNVCASLAMVTFCPLSIWLFGIYGLAFAVSAIMAVQNIFNCWLTKRVVGVQAHFQLRYALKIQENIAGQYFADGRKSHAAR